MPVISLNTYIDFINGDQEKRSKATLDNYNRAMAYTGIKEVDTDRLDELFKELIVKLDAKIPYGYIQNILKIIRSTLRLHGITWVRGYHYNLLEQRLQRCGTTPEAYSENNIITIVKAVMGNYELLKLIILCTYSGLRIGACQGLLFANFKRMPNGVYVYPVVSKGVPYIAALSEYAFEWLRKLNYPVSDYVVPFDAANTKSDFAKIYRMQLIHILMKRGVSSLLDQKQPFHGCRKFYAERLNESKMEPDEIAWLMGHIPNTTAFRKYINNIETGGPRLSEIYARTMLNSMRLIQ